MILLYNSRKIVVSLLQLSCDSSNDLVTTVAMENRMTRHAIFSPSTDARCQTPIFKKNRIYFAHRALWKS